MNRSPADHYGSPDATVMSLHESALPDPLSLIGFLDTDVRYRSRTPVR